MGVCRRALVRCALGEGSMVESSIVVRVFKHLPPFAGLRSPILEPNLNVHN